MGFQLSNLNLNNGRAEAVRAFCGMDLDGDNRNRFRIPDNSASVNALSIWRDSTSPADDDEFTILFQANDSGDNITNFASIDVVSTDVTNATEDGRFIFNTMQAGTLSEILRLDTDFLVTLTGGYNRQEGINNRYRLVWVAGQRGKPGLNADIQNSAEATRMVTDPDFEILGTNASSDDVTFYAEGGLQLQTDGADGDEVILLPHLDANQTAWTQVTWGTDKEVRWECLISTAAAITNCIIWAGLKLTNTEVTATDADQAFFRYENGVNGGKWQAINSIGGTDDAHDSGVTVATGTTYHLVVEIDSSRIARFYINSALVETSTALTDATDFIPYIGVAADGAAEAKTLYVHGQAISRAIG